MNAYLTRRPRTKRVFSEEDMVRMRDLYYDRARPMIQVADAFGVPVSTFLRWIAEMGWPRRTSSGPGAGRMVAPPSGLRATSPARCSETSPARCRCSETSPANAGEDRGPNIHDEAFAIEVAVAARRELRALGDLSGPIDKNLTLGERERRAALIANLSRSIARLDRVFELRTQRKALKLHIKHLEEELEAARNADIDRMVTDTAKVMLARSVDQKPKPQERTRLTLPE